MKKLNNFEKTIGLLKKIIRDGNCKHMNLSTIKGYLGELVVKSKLEKEGCNVFQRGNQSGYDLEFENIKIDVKTSFLKEETPGFPSYWGWALKHVSKKRKISCTHFVCVALDQNYKENAFYIIKKNDINYFPAGSKRFKGVQKRFGVFPGRFPHDSSKELTIFFEKCRKLERKGKVIKVKPSYNLRKILK